MADKKRGAKGLAVLDKPEVEIVGKTPDVVADEERRLAAIDQEVEAILGGAYTNDEKGMRGALALRGSNQLKVVAGAFFYSLKKSAGHGEYLTILERYGVPDRAARKVVAYARFVRGSDMSKPQRSGLALIGPTKVKFFEEFSDEELDALADGDEVHGLTLDKISRMSTSELQKALRAGQAKLEKVENEKGRLEAELNEAAKETARARRQFRTFTPSEREAQLRANFEQACGVVEVTLGRHGSDEPPSGLASAINSWLEEPEGQDEARLYIGTRLEYLSRLVASLRVTYSIDPIGGV